MRLRHKGVTEGGRGIQNVQNCVTGVHACYIFMYIGKGIVYTSILMDPFCRGKRWCI